MSDPLAGIDEALGQYVEIGHPPVEAELAAAVSRHVSGRPAVPARRDPETAAALRALAADPTDEINVPDVNVSPLTVYVDFNDLREAVGEPEVWRILGHLKDLFGGTP